MNNISIKGILLGLVVLVILDTLGELLLRFVFSGGSLEASVDTSYLIFRTLVGMIAMTLGGWITAKIAKSALYINTGIVGIVSLLLTVTSYNGSLPLWFNVIGFLFVLPCAMLGGYILRDKQKQ